MENIFLKYSDFFEDDGGMKRVLADFDALGTQLVSNAQRYKKDINEAFNSLNINALKDLESQIEANSAKYKELESAKASFIKIEKQIQDELRKSAQLEIQAERAKQAKISTTIKEIQGERELDRAIQQENSTKKSAIALSEAERKARQATEASINREKGAYAQLSAELRKLFTASANVAAEMYNLEEAGRANTPQYSRLSSEFNELQKRTVTLDGKLKMIDSSLGRNQRRVGDYASGFNGLSNSINQLTRELPAFAVSAQTGFLAISNNLPIFFDELSRITQAVKASTAEAKANAAIAYEQATALAVASGATQKQAVVEGILASETVMATAAQKGQLSVLSQLSKSIFSFNTLLSLGVVGLTLYGSEIVSWISKLVGADDVLKNLKESQDALNKSQLEGLKATVADERALRSYLAIASDVSLQDEEREIALKKLRTAYPFYFKDLTDQEILAGKTAKAENEVIKALDKRAEAEKANEQIIKNKQRILDLNDRDRKAVEEGIKAEKERIVLLKQAETALGQEERNARSSVAADRLRTINSLETERKVIKKEINGLDVQNSKYEALILKLQKESIGLDFQVDKSNKAKDKLKDQIKFVDYLASEYELKKLILENTIASNEEIFGSDKFTAEARLNAQRNLVIQQLALAKLDRDESLRILKQKYDEEKSETIKDSDGKIIGSKYTKTALIQLEKQYGFDVQKINEQFRQAEIDANKNAEKVMLIDRLNFQIDNLKYLQKNLSDSASVYDGYAKQISEIQTKIDNITNREQGLELNDKITINDSELKRITAFREKVEEALAENGGKITAKQRRRLLEQVETFEKEKTDIEQDAEVQRQLARLKSIEEEKKVFSEESNDFKNLEIERQAILKKLEDDRIKKRLDKTKEENKKILDDYKDFVKEFNKLIESVLDRIIKLSQQRIDQDEKALENQKMSIETQQQRAEAGLENTLAFEQRMQGKREAELIKSQRREQRLQKVKALYTSYSGYADKDPDTAISKALRDFALLEAISASFGEGGIPEDRLPSNGIFRGQSHQGNRGGIPIRVEGKEGIFSTKEMANLGKPNFYALKDMASTGKVDSNFFTGQKESFVKAVPYVTTDTRLLRKMDGVIKAIEAQPVPNWGLGEIANGQMELIETILRKNKIEINRHRTKKPRL